MNLDEKLREFLRETEPPAGLAVSALIRSSSMQLRPPKLPHESEHWVDRIRVPEFVSPSRRPTPPPPARLTIVDRARKVVTEFERAGPGLEAPGIDALLKLGPDALPALAEAFPGLLWFNRRHRHSGVARGRDVSPIARAFVTFGAPSVPYIEEAMRSTHPDIRYYALLVALELPQEELVLPIALAAVDLDVGIRAVAADAESTFTPERTRTCCGVWQSVLAQGPSMRAHVIFAIHAVARMRDQTAARHLVRLIAQLDDEVDDAACRALSVLTGQVNGLDTAQWNRWLDKNEGRNRIEWLIAGAAECEPSIYRFVLKELEAASGQQLGRPDVNAKRERKKLAKAYRRWWKSEPQD